MEINSDKFETYLCIRNDDIDNAAYDLVCALAKLPDGSNPEWDMSYIGEVVLAAKETLEENNIPVCHPYYTSSDGEDETPCPQDNECKIINCPFKNKQDNPC